MKQIETIKSGKNFTAVTAGSFAEIIEHELPMGPDFTLKGKVFLGQALGATGAELSYQTLVPGQDSGFPDKTAVSFTRTRRMKNSISSFVVKARTKWTASNSLLRKELWYVLHRKANVH